MRARLKIRIATLALAALAAAGAEARAQTGAVTGTVFDSLNTGPLADAAVFLWETPFQGVSDADGRFRIEGVPPGDYSILFFHRQLGEMGISPGPKPIHVEADRTEDVPLATPSMRTVVASQCLMEEREAGAGIVAGWVEDGASEMRLGGTRVSLSWSVPDSPEPARLSMTTGPSGWFYTCHAPAETPMVLGASFYGRESLRREVAVEPEGFAEVPITLHPMESSEVSGRLVDGASGRSVEGARVWLRGTDRGTLSNGHGDFDLGDVLPGTYMLVTEHLAYGLKMDTLVVPSGLRLRAEMKLDSRPIEIAPVTVTVQSPQPISASMAGGIQVTSEQIEEVRQRSRDASDILRSLHIPGVLVRHRSNGTICVGYITGQVKMNQTGCVEMLIFINDVRTTNPDFALRLPPDGIERMTIYKPLEAGNLFGVGGGNGVLMIYTKGN